LERIGGHCSGACLNGDWSVDEKRAAKEFLSRRTGKQTDGIRKHHTSSYGKPLQKQSGLDGFERMEGYDCLSIRIMIPIEGKFDTFNTSTEGEKLPQLFLIDFWRQIRDLLPKYQTDIFRSFISKNQSNRLLPESAKVAASCGSLIINGMDHVL
jgi:hypothetical protein